MSADDATEAVSEKESAEAESAETESIEEGETEEGLDLTNASSTSHHDIMLQSVPKLRPMKRMQSDEKRFHLAC